MSQPAPKKSNKYVFPRRTATEYGAPGVQIPIDGVLGFLGAIAGYVESLGDDVEFIPKTALQLLILPKSDVKAARKQIRIPHNDKSVASEVYAALPSTKGDTLTAPFLRARVVGQTLMAQINTSRGGLAPERQAARRRLIGLAGVELNLPSVLEHASLTLGHFVGDVPQEVVEDTKRGANKMLDGFFFTFRQVEYGLSQDIAEGILVPQPQSE